MTKLIEKLARASANVGSFAADKRNMQQKYDYISADQVLSRVGAALTAEGLMVLPAISEEIVDEVTTKKGQVRYDVLVSLEMTITDGDESITQQWLGRGSDYSVPDKALYKAITSGHKYFLMKLFNVGIGNEDGEHDEPARSSANGSGKQAEPLPDDEQVIIEGLAVDFWVNVLALIERYTVVQHAHAAAKKLGYEAVPPTPKERLHMYRTLKVEATTRDAEDAEAKAAKAEKKEAA